VGGSVEEADGGSWGCGGGKNARGSEGEEEGEAETKAEGEAEGEDEGERDGEDEGEAEGEDEGEAEGEDEGEDVGKADGEIDGDKEAKMEGSEKNWDARFAEHLASLTKAPRVRCVFRRFRVDVSSKLTLESQYVRLG
jgi:cobalamin biosynthesis protein CobT